MSQFATEDLVLFLDAFSKTTKLKEILPVSIIWKLRENVSSAISQILSHSSDRKMSDESCKQLSKMEKWVSSIPDSDQNHINFKQVMRDVISAKEEIVNPEYNSAKIWQNVDESLAKFLGNKFSVDKIVQRGINKTKEKKESFVERFQAQKSPRQV